MKVKKDELVLENSSPNVGTEHEEINSLGQTKWESDLWPFEGPKKWKKKKNPPVCKLAKWSLYFMEKKNRILSFLLVSFFIFSLYISNLD